MRNTLFITKGRLDPLAKNAFGLYIHVPFCLRRCLYCAFASSVLRPIPSHLYTLALIAEASSKLHHFSQYTLDTLYFGGGTPSLLDDHDIALFLDFIASTQGLTTPRELTLEANPEHVSPARAKSWKSLGFTRISLGIQAFDDDTLKFLGRKHSSTQAQIAVDTLHQAGFDEVCIDLIYGAQIPGDSPSHALHRWAHSLKTAQKLAPAHASCYELTLEPHTPLWTRHQRGSHVLCDDDTLATMMQIIPETLNMPQYEVSNYTDGSAFSAHNLSCWMGIPYLGIGPAAHSMHIAPQGVIRRANAPDVRAYLDDFQRAQTLHAPFSPAEAFAETLPPQMHLAERLILAARTRFAWNPADIARQLGADLTPFLPHLKRAQTLGLLESRHDQTLRTTPKGIRLNNRLDEILFDGAPETT